MARSMGRVLELDGGHTYSGKDADKFVEAMLFDFTAAEAGTTRRRSSPIRRRPQSRPLGHHWTRLCVASGTTLAELLVQTKIEERLAVAVQVKGPRPAGSVDGTWLHS